jgi:hypothetical protein
MGNLIRSNDLKRIYAGAALAVMAGLALGGAVQPPLTDSILAPQQEMAGGGTRNYASATSRDVGAYPGQVPDYVIGTNYTQPLLVADPQAPNYADEAEPTAYAAAEYAHSAEAVELTPARWDDEARAEPVYPSQQGNAYNPSDLPPAPEPPVETTSPG